MKFYLDCHAVLAMTEIFLIFFVCFFTDGRLYEHVGIFRNLATDSGFAFYPEREGDGHFSFLG